MEDKFILVDLNDKKSKNIAEVIGNESCKKIIDFLAEKNEASEQDIAMALKMPINTVEYNLNKLISSSLIESKKFFWSVKGKKIPMYGLSNKSIVISPRKINFSSLKTILPVFAISAIGALAIKYYLVKDQVANVVHNPVPLLESGVNSAKSLDFAQATNSINFIQSINPWTWFFIGACFSVVLYLLLTKLNKEVK